MFGFLKQVGDYTRDAVDAARNLAQGFSVTFDHMKRRPVTVQYLSLIHISEPTRPY